MTRPDDDFKHYLRQFTPRSPGRLPAITRTGRTNTRGWLLAASVAAATGLAVWGVTSRSLAPAAPASSPVPATEYRRAVTRADFAGVLDDPEQFDRVLTETSRLLLPDIERADSTLNRLAAP